MLSLELHTSQQPQHLTPNPGILVMRQCFTCKQGCFCCTFAVTAAVLLLRGLTPTAGQEWSHLDDQTFVNKMLGRVLC